MLKDTNLFIDIFFIVRDAWFLKKKLMIKNNMIEPEYTKKQIRRAEKIAFILFGEKMEDPDFRKLTEYGLKTNTGIVNLILKITFDPEEDLEFIPSDHLI